MSLNEVVHCREDQACHLVISEGALGRFGAPRTPVCARASPVIIIEPPASSEHSLTPSLVPLATF
jgi:hypothetical protein